MIQRGEEGDGTVTIAKTTGLVNKEENPLYIPTQVLFPERLPTPVYDVLKTSSKFKFRL